MVVYISLGYNRKHCWIFKQHKKPINLQINKCIQQITFCGVYKVKLLNSLLGLKEHSAAVHVFPLLLRNQFGTRLWTEVAVVAALL